MLVSFTDPLSVTITGLGTISLPRVSVGDDRSEYQSGDGNVLITASHDYGKRIRRVARIDTKKVSPDPFKPAENRQESMSFYMVFDLPKVGYTAAEALATYKGFTALAAASSDQLITKLLGGES
jgi:hypothetical protein